AFHPAGETLVSCDLKGVLKEWDASDGALKRDLTPAAALYKYDTSFRADIGGARCIAFSSDGHQHAAGGLPNCTNDFHGIGNTAKDAAKDNAAKDSVNTANEFHKLKLPTDGRDLALSPDKTQLAVAHADKTLRLYALHV